MVLHLTLQQLGNCNIIVLYGPRKMHYPLDFIHFIHSLSLLGFGFNMNLEHVVQKYNLNINIFASMG